MKSGISYTAFTARGHALAERLADALGGPVRIPSEPLSVWAEEAFRSREALVFVGAVGIAVRTIAPFVNNKSEDPAVVVLDEYGQFVIPLLSGHLGGANQLARDLAQICGGTAVITTATDLNGVFAVDLWAKKHGLTILRPEFIRHISARLLQGGEITVTSPWPVSGSAPPGVSIGDDGDVRLTVRPQEGPFLCLVPRCLTLGIGCRRNASAEQLESAFQSFCRECQVLPESIISAATIDVKREEQGLLAFCEAHRIPLHFFTAQELASVTGSFTGSDFVLETVGVDNVCERSAVLASQGALFEKKFACSGVSFAAALSIPALDWSC